MVKTSKSIAVIVGMFLCACSVQKKTDFTDGKDLASPIEGYYEIRNLKVGGKKNPNKKQNVFIVLKKSENVADFMMIYFQENNPSMASGTDTLKLNNGTIEAFFKDNKVASFKLKKRRVRVSYKQGDVYQFKAKQFRKKKKNKNKSF